jgi:predicted O-methyltransferase YrrM
MRQILYTIEDRLDHLAWRMPKSPTGTAEQFYSLRAQAEQVQYPEVDEVEREADFAIDPSWLSHLALHTQVVQKKSVLTYPAHGRLLYAILRRHIEGSPEKFFTVLETGTARGYSALCMAKAIADSGKDGRIITIDVLPHRTKTYWNCIDDLDGPKTRAELLAPWPDLLNLITFIQGDTLRQLPRIGVSRVNFAFLDAQHTKSAVEHEFSVVEPLQMSGDMMFFDDVTPLQFPGVVDAVNEIERTGKYKLKRLKAEERRSFAWGEKIS